MRAPKRNLGLTTVALVLIAVVAGYGQQTGKRTFTKTDRFDFGSGGTVTLTGAPNGSISVVSGVKNEIEVVAEVIIDAANEADAAKLGDITGFVIDDSALRVSITSVGSHNRFGLKKLPKNFPKHLLSVPFKINYTITLPRYADLEIDGGRGDVSVSGVEGALRLELIESDARIEVLSGTSSVTIAEGRLNIAYASRGSRRPANIQVGKGDLTVSLPENLSSELDAAVLRTGSIDNRLGSLKPRDRKIAFTDRSIAARVGVGGPTLKFTVGDGKLTLQPFAKP